MRCYPATLALKSWLFAACAVAFCLHASALLAADEAQLVVHLTNGREAKGSLDAASDGRQLVLATLRGGVTLRRSIPWKDVAFAVSDGDSVAVDALRQRAAGGKTATAPRKVVMNTFKAVKPQKPASQAKPEVPASSIAYLKFDAAIANWDGDVETDGLLLELEPLDVDGCVVAAGATVEVELFAPQRRTFDLAPMSGGDTLELVERWTRAIEPLDVGPSGIRLRLPFGAIHPELRTDWTAWHYGLVHVRLAAPGHGVFEASRDGVRIVPWAPNRDRLEMQTGGRFLWTERLGRAE